MEEKKNHRDPLVSQIIQEVPFLEEVFKEKRFLCDIISEYDVLEKVVEAHRATEDIIVLTNGAWDMWHLGHFLYILKARLQGSLIIVGVDSNELVQAIKGEDRPVASLMERVLLISGYRFVDVVTVNQLPERKEEIFKGAKKLINLVKPDILVVSKSTKNPEKFQTEMKEYESVCGEIVMLDPQATTSTTAKVRRFTMEGGKGLKDAIDNAFNDYMEKLKGGE